MLRPSRFDHGTLSVAHGQNARTAPQRIPNLLDELESFPDSQSVNVDGWINHTRNLGSVPLVDNTRSGCGVTYNARSSAAACSATSATHYDSLYGSTNQPSAQPNGLEHAGILLQFR